MKRSLKKIAVFWEGGSIVESVRDAAIFLVGNLFPQDEAQNRLNLCLGLPYFSFVCLGRGEFSWTCAQFFPLKLCMFLG